jgi:lycopene cyclase domain-containing protein
MNNKTKFLIWLAITIAMICVPILCFDIKGFPMQMTGNEWIHLPILENRYLYLIHHLLAAGPVFFFGIVLNLYSYRKVFVKDYWKPIFLISCIFIVWDILFTHYEIWSFDKSYVLGLFFLKIPIEEYLWFVVIPFCGMFVYHVCERQFKILDSFDSLLKAISLFLALVIYYIGMDKLYTAESMAFCSSAILFGILWGVPRYGLFLSFYGILLVPMFFFNGMLTGLFTKQSLVVYNWSEFSNIRILSFPVEDISFGFGLMYGIVCLKFYITNRLSTTYKDTK